MEGHIRHCVPRGLGLPSAAKGGKDDRSELGLPMARPGPSPARPEPRGSQPLGLVFDWGGDGAQAASPTPQRVQDPCPSRRGGLAWEFGMESPALPLSAVTLGKLLQLLDPQFPLL